MSTKIVYFTFNGQLEKAEFSALDSAMDVKDLFRSAAEASPYDILKLYNSDNSLVNISQNLEINTPDSAYRLAIIATSTDSLMDEVGSDLCSVEKRLESLEFNIIVENGGLPESMRQVSDQIESLNHKLESIEHLSWIGLSKDLNGCSQGYGTAKGGTNGLDISTNNNWKRNLTPHDHKMAMESDMTAESVFEKFHKMRDMVVKSEVKGLLEQVDFNNWQWNEPEMLVLLRQMYIDLGFLDTFNIPKSTFHSWLCEVYRGYNRVPFHNFKHCFMVSQMMYGLIRQLELGNVFSQAELFSLLTSAVCHDLDHPGYNNSYQINARTELALRYNDSSPLENHHCSIAFKILSLDECNILKNIPEQTYKHVRQCMIRCILATDMAKHNEILQNFRDIVPTFDSRSQDHRNQLMMILIKCADISNECRPMEVAEPWIDCLLQEFFNQSDLEKKEGLPVSPFMDRDKVNKSSSQVNFIKFVLLPLFDSLADLYPNMQVLVITPLQEALQYYQKMISASSSSPPPAAMPTAVSATGDTQTGPRTNGTI